MRILNHNSYIKTVAVLFVLFSPNVLAYECVVLLHGLARTASSMSKMDTALQKEGYKVVNLGYPSRKFKIEELAEEAVFNSVRACGKYDKVSFVTHSLGGILVRQYLSNHKVPKLKHVVMLGPPNKGSEVVDRLAKVPGFKLLNGPAGLQLGTEKSSVPNTLGKADFSLGIIAGTNTINFLLSSFIPNPDDGKVSVESTKLDGMKDHIILPVTHPFMMKNKNVIRQTIYFIKNGRFEGKG